MTKLSELISRWNNNDGKPFKGSLIDWDAYNENNHDIGCMCAQGQVLHLVGGWSHERLHNSSQYNADTEAAKLLRISRAHVVLLRTVNDKADGAPAIVLENPSAVIGDQWSKLLDFWWHLDGMTADQWDAARAAARAAAWDAARASNEIQGAKIMSNNGSPFFFLPAFGFANPDCIPDRPANYGVTA